MLSGKPFERSAKCLAPTVRRRRAYEKARMPAKKAILCVRDNGGAVDKEGKNAVKWTKLSCRRFQDNAERLEPGYLAREAGEVRGQVGGALQVRHLLAGGSAGAPPAVRGDSGTDRPAADALRLGVRLAAFDKAVRTSSPCVPAAPLGPISAAEQGRTVCALGSGHDRAGSGNTCWGKFVATVLLRG
jgi:hypothetical protein